MTAFLPSSPRSSIDDGQPSAPYDRSAQPPHRPAGASARGPTAVHCLIAVARHHGVDLSVERLVHDYALSESEVPLPRLLRIAREAGFRAARPDSAGRLLDWRPTVPLAEGLAKTIAYFDAVLSRGAAHGDAS